jgi:hypothetical protein
MTQTYHFDWSATMEFFLASKGIASDTSDADIMWITLEGYDDTNFVNLMLEYAKWLQEAEHDMSINPHADGSKYHRG